MASADIDGDGRTDLVTSILRRDYFALLPGACHADPRAPVLTDVRDVPNDDGGFVFVTWTASSLDVTGGSVHAYRVWRRIPPAMAQALRSRALDSESFIAAPVMLADGSQEIVYWEAMATLPAQRMPGYGYTSPTTQDSMRRSNPYTAFMITALTSNFDVFYSSNVDSGYSVDNIRPRRPNHFVAGAGPGRAELMWDPNPETDLEGYRLYRGIGPDFVPSDEGLIATLVEPGFVDPDGGAGFCYKLSAIDVHENESEFSVVDLTGMLDVDVRPGTALALRGVLPNPSAGRMAIHFSLARLAPGQLAVIDLAGRCIASYDLSALGAGVHVITVGEGAPLRAGVYLIRLAQGGQTREAKAIVLR
jgi:hypothetical protein